ncbi:MAG: GAF domain-containing protein [Spirochaetales bacterium]|nr:GAF domain-containing protein [Spirochaetales bacterium]
MHQFILMDKDISPSIDTSLYKKDNLFIINTILEKCEEIIALRTEINVPFYIILFISREKFGDIDKFLKVKNKQSKNLYFKLIVFCSSRNIHFHGYDKTRRISSYRNTPITGEEFLFIVENSFFIMEEYNLEKMKDIHNHQELVDVEKDQRELIEIGKALSSEKNHEKLLELILKNSRKITGADAGSIFLIESDENGDQKLVFKHAQTYSLDISYKEFSMPLNTDSLAGYVAVKGERLNFPDVYALSRDAPVSFNSSFDREHNYRTKSMLVVPMKNHIDQIIGVIQLINCKELKMTGDEFLIDMAHEIKLKTPEDFEHKVVPFKTRYETLLEAIANQAAIAIENNRMIKQIQQQFEEFVKASVTAIESRDPATSGHSFRVAKMCVEMAHAINKEKTGAFKGVSFSMIQIKELEYAALLHDFGKVYIDCAIFQKEKKLFPKDYRFLHLKLDYLYRFLEIQYLQKENDLKIQIVTDKSLEKILVALVQEKEERLARIKEIKEKVKQLNEPQVLEENPEETLSQILKEINECMCTDLDERKMIILDNQEKINLSIKKGSLNPIEREEIESHVIRSYSFVSKIPWPPEFKNIPEITQKHHEKLDGTGYPNRLKGKENIPVQARMIVIADIYDALTASDRPYKKAVPLEKTLEILTLEAKANKIDADLVELIKKYKIYEKITG